MAPIPQVPGDMMVLIPLGVLAVIVGIFVNTARVDPLPLRAQPLDEGLTEASRYILSSRVEILEDQ